MTDIRQTPEYANYLKLLGWKTEKVSGIQIFIKKIPLIGSIIKVQRIPPPIPFEEIEKIALEHHSYQILIDQEFPPPATQADLSASISQANQAGLAKALRAGPIPPISPIPKGYLVNKAPYLPTKTIWVDLRPTEEEIFNSFSEAKRRAVRRAIKNGITVKEAGDYQEFIWLKKQSLYEKFILPIMAEKEIKSLWQAFCPDNGRVILAYYQQKPVAGIFLLYYDKVAYYWLAAATNLGKKLFAPTLLTWETLKIAKKLGGRVFDFEGIYDERFPIKSWLGFTKFKEGFGGKEIIYPPSLVKNRLSFF